MKHTETPWVRDEVDRYHIVCNREKTNLIRIATVNKRFPEAEANRDFIVRAVNSHEALVEALRKAIGWFESLVHDEYDGTTMLNDMLAEMDDCRAALKKAGA